MPDYQTATNPQTGARMIQIGGAWQPLEASANNPKTGERAFKVSGKWVTAPAVNPTYGQRVNVAGQAFDKAAGTGLAGVGNTLGAALDVGANMASGALADIAGAATSIATQNPQRGARVQQRVANLLAPTSAAGRAAENYVGALAAPVAKVANAIPGYLQRHGHPILAQTARAVQDVVGGEESLAGKGIRALTKAPEVARAVKESESAGFTLPISQAQPGLISRLAESVSGKVHTQQALSTRNTTVGNGLVRKGLGLKSDAPLTVDTMEAIRKRAGQDYAAVEGVSNPTVQPQPGGTFHTQLDTIAGSRAGSIRGAASDDKIVAAAAELKGASAFTTTQALNEIRSLRDQTDTAFRQGEKRLGSDFKKLAGAVEGAIDEHLQKIGAPADLVAKFRAARQRIAQSYDIEESLDGAGNVDLQKLGARFKKGKMTGPIATAGQFGKRFGNKYGQAPGKTGSVLPTSLVGAAATEYGVGALTGHGHLGGAAAAATIAGRIALQHATTAKLGQKLIGLAQQSARKGTRAAVRTGAAATTLAGLEQQ